MVFAVYPQHHFVLTRTLPLSPNTLYTFPYPCTLIPVVRRPFIGVIEDRQDPVREGWGDVFAPQISEGRMQALWISTPS